VIDPKLLLTKLSLELDKRAKAVKEATDWYEGRHPIPDPPPNTSAAVDREAHAAFVAMSRLAITNFLPPIVDVPAAKLHVEGFRFSESPTSTDVDAWTIWGRNHLDGDYGLVRDAALQTGQGFVLVWPDKDGKAEITVEDPAQTIVVYEAGSRRRRAAGLKRWVDEDGRTLATLYTPTAIYKFQSRGTASGLIIPGATGFDSWTEREVPDEPWPLPNPFGEVTLVETRANPPLKAALYGGGQPEFTKQLNEQRRINQTVMNMLVTMEYQAFRQRWVTGWDYPTLPDGTPDRAQIQKASAARMWTFKPGEDGDEPIKVGEFSQADFRPFIDATLMWVKVMASTSGTPPYAFLLGDMINVASDSLARIEGIQTSKVRDHGRTLGADAAEVIRLALLVENNPKANDPAIRTVWGEFEERTATEQANLAVQAKSLGAPDDVVFAMLPGVDQAEALRWVQQNRAARLIEDALAPEIDPEPPSDPGVDGDGD
jgi:hypothetical protein